MKIQLLLLVTLLLTFNSLRIVSHNVDSVDGVFALTWLGGLCESISCSSDQIAKWDHQSFTIHGIRGLSVNGQPLGDLNLDNIADIQGDLNNYMPPQITDSDSASSLWDRELSKNGKNYAEALLELQSDQFSADDTDALQKAYFADSLNFYHTLNAQKVSAGQYSQDDLAALFQVSPDQLYFECDATTGDLVDVKICVSITPNLWTAQTCSSPNPTCSADQTLVLSGWSQSSQDSVFSN